MKTKWLPDRLVQTLCPTRAYYRQKSSHEYDQSCHLPNVDVSERFILILGMVKEQLGMAFTYPNIVLSGVAWFLECQGFLKFTIN